MRDLLISKPLDAQDPNARAKERDRRLAMVAASTLIARGVAALTVLVTIPLTVRYLGAERYGLWMAVTTINAFLAFADLGIGNGLLNMTADAFGKNDRAAAARYVSSAFIAMSGMAVLLGCCFAAVYRWIPWADVFRTTTPLAGAEAGPAAAAFVACTLLSLPLGVVQRVQFGCQEGYIASIWQAVGSILGLIAVIAVIRAELGLPWLITAILGGPLIASGCNWVVEFGVRNRWRAPRLSLFDLASCQRILSLGLLLFSSQVSATVIAVAPVMVLTRSRGPIAVASFSIVYKMLSFFVLLSGTLASPLWPAYGEALARGDGSWIRRSFLRSLGMTAAVAVVPALLIGGISPWAVQILSSGRIETSHLLGITVALLCIGTAIRGTISMLVAGCNLIRRTAVVFPLAAVCAFVPMVLPSRLVGEAVVPLWVGVCECLVIAALVLDARPALAAAEEPESERPEASTPVVC